MRFLVVCCSMAMLLMGSVANAAITNPNTLVFLWTSDIRTLDPAYVGSTPGSYAPLNSHDRLLNYDGKEISEFLPGLSAVVPTVGNGLIQKTSDGKVRYSFPIRSHVFCHQVGVDAGDGSISWKYYDDLSADERRNIVPGHGEITAEDVKYAFMRAMLQGESWMANAVTEMISAGKYSDIEAWAVGLTGVESFDQVDEAGLLATYEDLSSKIEVADGVVTIVLDSSFPATLGIMALPFSTSVIDKEWAVANGAWPGTGSTWIDYHKPELGDSALFEIENGSGPFMIEEWDRAEKKFVLKRFEGYWRGPAPLERVVVRNVTEWTTRLLQLEAGDADVVATPVEFLQEVGEKPGIFVQDGLPAIYGRGLFYGWPLRPDSDAIGSGKLDGKGVPPDFFGDLDVRKGFNYAQNYDVLIEQIQLGKTVQSRGPTVRGLMGYRSDSPIYSFDQAKAAEHFKKAFGGKLWDVGFEVTGYHTTGNSDAQSAFAVLQQSLAQINPKFKLKTQELQWSAIADMLWGADEPAAPLTYMGWGPDYTDPGGPLGAATYYLASTGLVAGFSGSGYQQLMREEFDSHLKEAWELVDPAVREPIYAMLQAKSHELATTMFLWEAFSYIVTRDWVHGYVHNKITYGAWDFYNISKSE